VAKRWTIEFRDHREQVRRVQGFSDRASSEGLGRRLERLAALRATGESPDVDTMRWLQSLPANLRARLIAIGLLDKQAGESGKPLSEHLEAFHAKLQLGFRPKTTSGTCRQHVKAVYNRVVRIIEGCGFHVWSDIDLDVVQEFLGGLNLSDTTHNYYRRDFLLFCRWMLESRRAGVMPGGDLPPVETEDKEDKRAFTIDEMKALLKATEAGPVRQGLKGYDRAVLYLIAAETGFRLREMKSLRVGSFDFADCSVTLEREYTKDRRQAVIPLKQKRAKQLKEYFKGRDPDEKAFPMHKYPRAAEMIRADLKEAGLSYVDDQGRKACFHSLRKSFVTNLDGTDASLAERMSLVRHSMRGNLTLGTYTQVQAYNLRRVIEQLPDLPWPGTAKPQTEAILQTGTCDNSGFGARLGAPNMPQHGTTCDSMRQTNRTGAVKNAILKQGPVAQRSEQWTHNPLVVGSNPTGPIGGINAFLAVCCACSSIG